MKNHLLTLLAVVGLGTTGASAQTLTAELSSPETEVGVPVEFTISASGKSQARLLDDLEVEGLRVAGKSDQFQMQMSFPGGVQVTTRTVLTLVPQREGEFRIPPLRVRLDGRVVETPECVLQVRPGSGGIPVLPAIPVPQAGGQAGPGGGAALPPDPDTPARAFGEIVLAKTTCYAGELVPAELRFFVDTRLPAEFSQRVNFGGEGFTVQRTGEPSRAMRQEGSAVYQSLSFPTAITAAKTGVLEIPPASLPARIQVPAQVPGGMPDLFGGLFNFGFTETREIEIRTEPAKLEVRPLPLQGQPAGFQGAIGDFRMAVEASPKTAGPGEPITLKVRVSGRGNFEAMGPPVLEDAGGWRVYDPSESFQPSPGDPIGYIGEKTFEFTLVARTDQKATPPVKFSFFNPETGKYQTLEGPPVAIEAAGQTGAVAGASTPAPGATSPAEEAAPAPQADARGDLSRDFAPRGFRPAAWAPGFLWTGAALALAWLAAAAALLARNRAGSPAALRKARLRELRAELRRLASPAISDAEFLERAARLARERLGRESGGAPPEELSEGLEEIFSREAEAKFSTRGTTALGDGARSRMLETLRALDRALPALAFAACLWLTAGSGRAATIEEAFESYGKGEFARAAREFESAQSGQPPSAGLEFNLGMALKRDGQPGPAALHLLRALALNPRMADARIALSDLDRSQGIPFRPPGWRERLAETVSLPAVLVAGFVLFWLGAFAILPWIGKFSPAPLAACAAAMTLGALLFCAAYLSDPRFAWRNQAVALAPTPLLSAPAERSDTVARLAPGTRARVLNRSGEWLALGLEDGRRGWAPAASFAPVISGAF